MQMYVRAILLFHSSAGQTKKGENHDYSCCEWTHTHANFNNKNKSFHCDFTVNFLISAKF